MNKKRIITSALIGTIALAGLSVSLTLAWYGASDRLSVNSLDVSITSTTNLKISTSSDLDTFVSDLDLSPKDEEFVFSPVSSMKKDSWMSVKSDTPFFYDCSNKFAIGLNGEHNPEQAKYGFFQQKVYLLNTGVDYYATLDTDPESLTASIFEANDEVNYARAEQLKNENPEWDMEVSEIKDKLDSLVNCLRISILVTEENHYNYYIIDPTKQNGDVTYLGGRLDNDRNGYYDVYSNHEIIYGEYNDISKVVYDDPTNNPGQSGQETSLKDQYFGNSFEAESKGTAYTFNEQASLANGFEFAKEESFSLSDIDSEATKLLIPCYSNVPTEIVVSIYLEGWDLDCINSTMGASFTTKLSFKLLRGIIG